MKILLTILRHRLSGGTQGFGNRLALRLVERGHRIVIACRSHEAAADPRIEFARLRTFAVGSAWRAWSFARAVERHLQGNSYDVVMGLSRCWSQDVVRVGGGCYATYLEKAHRYAVGPLRRLADVVTRKHKVFLEIERRIFSGPGLSVITNSNLVKNDIVRRYGVDPTAISVVYNGVDVCRFSPALREREGRRLRENWGIPREAPLLLFLGSGYGRKGLDVVLEALGRMARRGNRPFLAVVGRESSSGHYRALAKRLGLASHVRMIGPHSSPEICFAAADTYVLPSRYDAFSNTTLEAMASGLPVVVTASDGASELVQHRKNGSVLPAVPEPDVLVDELAYWMDPVHIGEAREVSRSIALQHTAEIEAEETLGILEQASRRRRSA